MGGAGNKCLFIALGEADTYISLGLSYWDICAPEVVVKAMGGIVTDLFQQKLHYDLETKPHGVRGVIIAKSP